MSEVLLGWAGAFVAGILASLLYEYSGLGRWWRRWVQRRRRESATEFPWRGDYDTFDDYMAAVRQYMAAKGLPDVDLYHTKGEDHTHEQGVGALIQRMPKSDKDEQ